MATFTSINVEDGSEPEERTIEAREAEIIRVYERALRGRDIGAQADFRWVLAEPLVEAAATEQLQRIKFLSLKNLAELLAGGGAPPPTPGAPQAWQQERLEALRLYCAATEMEGSDAVLWNRLATLAAELGCWAVAKHALERGLECDPQHPALPDKLLQLLLHMGDSAAAAQFAAALLRQRPWHGAAAATLHPSQLEVSPPYGAAAVTSSLLLLPPGEATGNDAAAGTGIGGASLPAAQEQATPARGGAVVEDAEAEPALAAPDAHRQADAAEGQLPQGAGGQEGAVHRDAPTAVVEQRTTRSRAAGRGKALAAGSANDGGHEQTWQLLLIAGPLLALPTAASGAAASPVRKDDLQPAAALAVAAAGEEQATSMDEQAKQEAAAVSAFLRDLPSRGVPRQLLPALVLRRLADPAQAAALPNATRPLLLQLAQAATRSPAAAGELPPAQCLVLAELHADAAAAAATARSLPAVGRLQQTDRVSGRIDGPPSLRARRTGGSKEQQLGVHNLCEGGIIWLLRFRITLAQQGQLMSPQLQQVAPARPTASEHHAQALAGPTREGTPTVSGESGSTTVSNDSVSDPSHGGEGVVRYWWALGRLQESRGETAVAAVSYNHCLAAFAEHGMEAPIVLPHCRTDGGITPADVAGKLEVLRLHGMLVEAAEQAQRGAAIARNIGPALLSCDAREEHLQLLDRQLWIRGLQLLLQAAAQEQAAEQGGPQGATGRADGTPPAAGSHGWLLGLRCHLRLLAAVLPPVPASVLPLLGGEDDWEKQPQAAAAAAAAALKGVSDALAASPAAAAALEAAVECLSAFGQQAWRCQQQGGQQQASTDAGGGADSDAGPVTLQPLEWQLLRRVQMQLLVHSWQQLVCDAAICTIHLATAAPLRPTPASMSGERPLAGAPASAARVAELLWALCEVLGPAGALPLERGRAFLRACMAELKLQLDRVNQEQHGAEGGAAGRQVDAEDEPTAEETAAFLQSGIHHCLLWLSGVDLRTRDDQEWCAGFQADARGAGQECLAFANKDAVAEVWPLVAPQMLREAQAASRHMAKFRGFLEAVAVQFPGPPAAVARQSMAAWQRMATREAPPVAGAGGSAVQLPPNPMRTVFADALEAAEAASAEAADASPEPMDVEEVLAGHVLGEEGDAQLEAYLAPAKADLCYNPGALCTLGLGWAYLAARYHEAADMLLASGRNEEGCEQLKPGELEQRPPLLQRLARWRRLGHWCCAVGLGIAGLESNRGFLLKLAGHKLLGDLQNAPPRFDQQARRPSKDSPAYKQQLAAATAAFQAAAAALPHDWKLQLLLAKCKRKEGRPPADWLPLLARACRLAEAGQWGKGGLAEPLYALHAARAKLLLGAWYQCRRQLKQQTTVDSQGPSGAGMEGVMCWQQAGQLLPLLARHCFLQHSQAQAAPLVASLESPAAADQSVALRSQLERVLLHDCATAMRWIVERQRSYHKAARRLAQVLHVLEGSGAAAEALAPLFTPARSTKAAFTINMHAVAEEIGPCSIDAADGDVPESDWGLQPARLAGIGVNEQLPSFYARLRRCLCSYLDLLVDSRGVAVLAAADNFFATGAMGWHVACLADMEQKAKGLLVVGLASALQKAVPFEQLTCPEEEAKQPQGGDGKAAAIHSPRAAVAAPGGESPKATPPSSDQRPPRKTPIAARRRWVSDSASTFASWQLASIRRQWDPCCMSRMTYTRTARDVQVQLAVSSSAVLFRYKAQRLTLNRAAKGHMQTVGAAAAEVLELQADAAVAELAGSQPHLAAVVASGPPGGPVPAGGIGTPLPGGVPSIADAKQLEQAAALLRAARSLHKEVQQGPSAKAGKEPATPRATGLRDRVEALLLRAYGLHAALATGSVGRHAGRAEVLRACDEISRQQRRASRPPPAVGGAGAAGAPAAEKMSPVPEERQQGQRGRTRARSGGAVGGAADDGAPEPSGTRKRAREAGGGAAGETPAAPAGFAAPPAHRPPEPAGIAGTAERPPLLSPLSPEDVKEMMALVEQEREEQERGAKRRRSEESGGRGEDVAQQADERADLEHDAGQEPPAQTSTAAAAGVAE
eukprot:scaffold26.g3338.t1